MIQTEWPLSRIFAILTKQYIGQLALRMAGTPIERYYFPLYIIGKNSGKISQQELADQVLTDKVSLVRVLDILTEDGWVERLVNPADRRQHLLCVTEKAKPWIQEIEDGLRETNTYFLDFIPEEKRTEFKEMLSLMVCKSKNLPIEDIEIFYNRPNQK
ncbi:MAG: MarR family transcriptional regulator [Crocinitomicaceae bacterium]